MGLEARTVAEINGKEHLGRLHVDSTCVEFSSKTKKWSLPLDSVVSATSVGKQLTIESSDERACFEMEKDGSRWVSKILFPPSKLEKLGVTASTKCWLSPGFGRSFANEIRGVGGKLTRDMSKADLAFFHIKQRESISKLVNACERLGVSTPVWVVYPKGSNMISQADVMKALRAIGFGPAKTAVFEKGWSSMRYHRKKSSS